MDGHDGWLASVPSCPGSSQCAASKLSRPNREESAIHKAPESTVCGVELESEGSSSKFWPLLLLLHTRSLGLGQGLCESPQPDWKAQIMLNEGKNYTY